MRLAHAYLIHQHFLKASKPSVHETGQNVAAWHLALGEPLDSAVVNLRKQGFLTSAWSELFSREVFQSAYFQLLSGLPLDQRLGKSRDEILDEAISQNYELAARIVRSADFVIASDPGLRLAETYTARHKKAQEDALESFRERDLAKALQASLDLRDDLGFPLGTVYQRSLPKEWLELLANSSPTALAPLPPDLLEELRGELAVEAIIDTGRRAPETQWPISQQGYTPYSKEGAKDLLRSAVRNQHNLAIFRRMGTERVAIFNGSRVIFGGPAAVPSCAVCSTLRNRDWPIHALPELPHPGCSHFSGCRCIYVRLVSKPPLIYTAVH
jgi:hypothetical protein